MPTCSRHPKVETSLRCSRCESYICPDCAVLTPVGYRCRKCGLETSATHSLSPLQLAMGLATGAGLGFAATVIVPARIGYLIIFLAALIGGFVGQAVTKVIGRKSSPLVGAATAAGFVTGAIVEPLRLASQGAPLAAAFSNPWPLVFGGVAGAVAWAQLK